MDQTERIAPISTQDLMILGLQEVAYIKPVVVDGRTVYAVHAADGREVVVMAEREVALATIRQNDLEPLSVH
jgi:hypothetical protein